MSSVRMCDNCGTVFSEKEEGWSTGTGTMFKTVDGKRQSVQVEQDKCGDCTELANAPRRPIGQLTNAHYDHDIVDAEVRDA
jgi:hypothetical protein